MSAGEPNRLINSVPEDAVHFVLGALVAGIELHGSVGVADLAAAVEHWHRWAGETAAQVERAECPDGCDECHE